MKIINEQLYLEFSEMVSCIVESTHRPFEKVEKYIRKAKSTQTKCWSFLDDPQDKRRVLIGYEDLKPVYKEMVLAKFGNPYEYLAKEPIKSLVLPDHVAEEFFLQYKYDGDKYLPTQHVQKYARAASWLNMLVKLNENKKIIKKELKISLDIFWVYVCELLKNEDIGLPTSYQRLRTKMKEYKEQGYSCLIDWRFGNKLAAKVSDEIAESLLLELIALPNQHDDTIICRFYNQKAKSLGYKPITPATVGIHRRKNNYQIMPFRAGNNAWYDQYGKIIHRNRPTAPLLLIGSDDNELDLYFKDERKGRTNHYYRYVLIVVMDAYNDYILGYSYGESATAELIKAAYLDAVHHIKELTGSWYLMNQIQTDRFGYKALEGFYRSLATYTPATARVARAKYIERAFGTTWHQLLKMYPNYAGGNITSKNRINPDYLAVAKSQFPTFQEGVSYIEDFINRLRNLPDTKTGITKKEQWLTAFKASELSQQHQISEARMLYLFGQKHTHTNTITNGGLKVTINGETFVYDIPDELYLQNVGKEVQVYYDPYDYSRVLVTDDNNLRFVARAFENMSGAIADYSGGERARLQQLLTQKRNHVQSIAFAKQQREEILERASIDAKSLLQASVLVKEVKHQAELQYHQSQNNRHTNNYDPLDQM